MLACRRRNSGLSSAQPRRGRLTPVPRMSIRITSWSASAGETETSAPKGASVASPGPPLSTTIGGLPAAAGRPVSCSRAIPRRTRGPVGRLCLSGTSTVTQLADTDAFRGLNGQANGRGDAAPDAPDETAPNVTITPAKAPTKILDDMRTLLETLVAAWSLTCPLKVDWLVRTVVFRSEKTSVWRPGASALLVRAGHERLTPRSGRSRRGRLRKAN